MSLVSSRLRVEVARLTLPLFAAKWNAKVTDFGLVKTIMKPKANEAPAADNATYEMTGCAAE